MCVCVCAGACEVCMHSYVKAGGYPLGSLHRCPHLPFLRQSLIQSGPHPAVQTGWAASPRDLRVSALQHWGCRQTPPCLASLNKCIFWGVSSVLCACLVSILPTELFLQLMPWCFSWDRKHVLRTEGRSGGPSATAVMSHMGTAAAFLHSRR